MLRFLVIVTVAYLGMVGLCAAFVAGVLYSLRRRNRVAATTRTPAPVTWLVSPRAPARMHRRLRNACTSARLAYSPTVGEAHPQLPDLAHSLEREAVLTDELLVAASVSPRPHRRRSLQPLQAQVAEIERLAQQIAHTARRAGPSALPQAADGLRDVADQLEALRQAQAEVDAVEQLAQGRVELTPDAARPGPVPPAMPSAPPAPPVQII
ncbi:MAG: hypothetical protein KDB10_10240 [Acidimicrobiales bacterium]|nr:hypothetical protein [Acidimicrobiales bacterium]